MQIKGNPKIISSKKSFILLERLGENCIFGPEILEV